MGGYRPQLERSLASRVHGYQKWHIVRRRWNRLSRGFCCQSLQLYFWWVGLWGQLYWNRTVCTFPLTPFNFVRRWFSFYLHLPFAHVVIIVNHHPYLELPRQTRRVPSLGPIVARAWKSIWTFNTINIAHIPLSENFLPLLLYNYYNLSLHSFIQ